ncbi:enoyl-ACP reductase FabI [Parachitinimonas caeni]|uniref:Enoyl-[acyl-carrier-protein] reductase [NADH] n=1 Tax=Parachitinimonas caeni TaxID=3031301 RepID=A0ABT7DXS6_9NEIS|nr:enoyl-ACP reductase FabI [Parachitinimonas caeni]MDK2123970.1 enoyl-ACP reductase FabI [Parachitinimonas caeni]
MGFLANKKILITGLLSNRSIAYGIAEACKREGATLAFTYVNDKLKDRVVDMAHEFGSDIILRCDVSSDEEIAAMLAELGSHWDGLDGLVHSIGFAPREALSGDYLDSVSREAFHIAHDISSYSFAALAKAARPMMQNRNASMLTLSYLGAERAVPNYNVMGLAKASLEANVRYMASSLGPEGIRVNGISAGPIKTLAAAGISGFSKILHHVAAHAPMRRNVTIEEVGNVAAFMLSDLSSGITGEITHVDGGYSTTAAGLAE